MRIGTTPTFTFGLPFSSSMIDRAHVVFYQNGKVVLKKCETDFKTNSKEITVDLTERETFLFEPDLTITVQAHIKTVENQVLTSNEHVISAIRCLDDEVIST